MARPSKPLTREDIERAMRVTLSNRAAARYLHVSYPHYKKYATLYKDKDGIVLYEKHRNQSGRGIPKFATTFMGGGNRKKEPALADILEGRVSANHFDSQHLKYKLISAGYLEPKCNRCGYDRARILDGRSPLILKHKNGDTNDWHLENLEFICYNCAFLEGPNSVVTDEMVEKAESGLDRHGPSVDSTFELDDYQKQYLENIFKDEPKERPGEEFITKF